jgi:hypothetical protein
MRVRIYKPSKTAMQSIHAKKPQWMIECVTPTKREPEPLMGWTRSEDTLNQISLKFDSCEAAIAHAERQGWEYSVLVDRERRVKPRNYGDNFKYRPPEEA